MIKALVNIESSDPHVQFEQLHALTKLCDTSSLIDYNFLEKYIKSDSWLVANASYALVNQVENKEARLILIKKYKSTLLEFEKLLILRGLANNYSGPTFKLFKAELTAGESTKILSFVIENLKNAEDPNTVYTWVDKYYNSMPDSIVDAIAKECMRDIEGEFSSTLYIKFLNWGYNPNRNLKDGEPYLYTNLYEGFSDFEKKEKEGEELDESDMETKELMIKIT